VGRVKEAVMRGAVLYAPGDVRVEERKDPTIVESTDAIIRLAATNVCGADLWPYRGLEAVDGPPRWATSTSASSSRSAPRSRTSGRASSWLASSSLVYRVMGCVSFASQ
jgi:hypothetical protein